jgi:hypothetical protein
MSFVGQAGFIVDTDVLVIYLRDPKHVEWVKSFVAVLEEMRKYVMEYHTTGLSWNPKVRLLPPIDKFFLTNHPGNHCRGLS